MKIFWIVLFVSYVLMTIANAYPSLCFIGKNSEKQYKPNKYIYILITIIFILVSGLRSGVGDTGTYRHIFDTLPSSISTFLSSDIISEDKGFYLIATFVKQFISTDSQAIIFVMALITLSLICYGLYKYTDDVRMAIFLFITMGCFSTSMNGMRQYVAAAILFYALPLIKKRKLIPYLIVVYIASTIHASAIIFYPIYFLNRCKGWGIVSYLMILGGAFLFLTYNITGPMIAEILGETQYGHYADSLMSNDQGANMLRVAVSFVPIALSWLGKNRINKDMEFGSIAINLNILNFIFMLLASKYWLYARFCIYFNLYSIMMFCYGIDNVFEKRSAKIIKLVCMVCYIVFFWYDSFMSGLRWSSEYIKI